jgi:hypothetical protein
VDWKQLDDGIGDTLVSVGATSGVRCSAVQIWPVRSFTPGLLITFFLLKSHAISADESEFLDAVRAVSRNTSPPISEMG